MRRRILLQRALRVLGALTLGRFRVFGQPDSFTIQQRKIMLDLASAVLPSALGKSRVSDVVTKFENYVKEYRAGADTDHGYGFTQVVPKPPSPAIAYAQQLLQLPSPVTRDAIEKALREAGVQELPRVPDGKSVVADLMSFYFRSSEANDLCYSAAIGRDQCRGLPGSDQTPAALRRSA